MYDKLSSLWIYMLVSVFVECFVCFFSIVFYFLIFFFFFFFQAEDGIRDWSVTGVQTCALPISLALGGLLAPRGPLWHLVARWPGFLRASAMRGTKTLSACSTVSLHPGPLLFYPVPLASLPEVLL